MFSKFFDSSSWPGFRRPAIFRACLAMAFAGLLTIPIKSVFAQVYPVFPAGTENSNIRIVASGSLVAFGSDLYPNALQFIYGDQNQNLALAYTTDGRYYASADNIKVNGEYQHIQCNAGGPQLCSPAAAVYNGNLYVAFGEQFCGCLHVLEGTRMPGTVLFNWSQILVGTLTMTSPPAMAVTPDGANLVIRYGTSNQNRAWSSVLHEDRTWTLSDSQSYAPTGSALVSFNGSLYAIDKQNNSDNGVFVKKLDDNGVLIAGTDHQVLGWFTKQGLSATVWNGEIVVAGRVNDSSDVLQIEVSMDGSQWYQRTYPGHYGGGDYAIATYQNGLPTAVRSDDPTGVFFSNFGTQ